MKRRVIAGILSFLLLFSFSGCGTSAQAKTLDLMAGVEAAPANAAAEPTDADLAAVADVSVRLFQNGSAAGENSLLSPFSILCALAMTANGAKGETLEQMEDVFGLSLPELNDCLHALLQSLPSDDKDKVSIADSIWLKDDERLTVEQSFLQTNADEYGASVYKAAFDDGTLKDINAWVDKKTDGMIENILDKIPQDAVLYLINALSFDAEWENIYKENQVHDGTFTTESGETRNVKMMAQSEGKYLNDGNATGFLKYYAGRKYAFAALLPNEGLSMDDYIASLSGGALTNTLTNAQDSTVQTEIPKFEAEFSVELRDALKSMGMTDAFDSEKADFTGLGRSESGNLFISRVLHKTHIAVDEKGTKAGAATVVEMTSGAALPGKTVLLDRPFLYMLIDCETNLPLFIGTMMDPGE